MDINLIMFRLVLNKTIIIMKRFTTSYYDDYDYEAKYGKQPEGFDTIEDAVKWNEERNIPLYLIKVTEWDLNYLDYQGVPEIIETTNLEEYEINIKK